VRQFRLPWAVFAGLVAFELVLLTFVDTSTRPLEPAGGSFQLRNVAAGTVISQRLEVAADGFGEVLLDGSITPGNSPAILRAQIHELNADGAAIGMVRTATAELEPSASECCDVRFQPIHDSRWRAYRLELTVGELNGRQLSLWAAPAPVNGLLTINGRPQAAFLVFRTAADRGTGLGRLADGSAGRNFLLAAMALLCNAAVAVAVHLLTTTSDP
jgi:hypothetical protein